MDLQRPSALVERYSVAHCLPHVTLDVGPHYIVWLNPKCHCAVVASVALPDRTPGHSGVRRRGGVWIGQTETRVYWPVCLHRVA